jgi:hypothetical protein
MQGNNIQWMVKKSNGASTGLVWLNTGTGGWPFESAVIILLVLLNAGYFLSS